jgi:hypothetical protein
LLTKRELFLPAVVVAMVLIFPAFGRFPYSYYMFLRWVACATAVVFAIVGFRVGHHWAPLLFVPVAVLFNPLIPFHMRKSDWLPLDVGAAILFIMCAALFDRSMKRW